jgi:hypothetical protein
MPAFAAFFTQILLIVDNQLNFFVKHFWLKQVFDDHNTFMFGTFTTHFVRMPSE